MKVKYKATLKCGTQIAGEAEIKGHHADIVSQKYAVLSLLRQEGIADILPTSVVVENPA